MCECVWDAVCSSQLATRGRDSGSGLSPQIYVTWPNFAVGVNHAVFITLLLGVSHSLVHKAAVPTLFYLSSYEAEIRLGGQVFMRFCVCVNACLRKCIMVAAILNLHLLR